MSNPFESPEENDTESRLGQDPPTHSVLGLVSFGFSILASGMYGLLITLASLDLLGPRPYIAEYWANSIAFVCFVAFLIGFISLFQQTKTKNYAFLGLAISAGIVLYMLWRAAILDG